MVIFAIAQLSYLLEVVQYCQQVLVVATAQKAQLFSAQKDNKTHERLFAVIVTRHFCALHTVSLIFQIDCPVVHYMSMSGMHRVLVRTTSKN